VTGVPLAAPREALQIRPSPKRNLLAGSSFKFHRWKFQSVEHADYKLGRACCHHCGDHGRRGLWDRAIRRSSAEYAKRRGPGDRLESVGRCLPVHICFAIVDTRCFNTADAGRLSNYPSRGLD
jgi:hypothetical protein